MSISEQDDFSCSFSTTAAYWQEADVFRDGGSNSNLQKNKNFLKEFIIVEFQSK